jgi:hypothetical protein
MKTAEEWNKESWQMPQSKTEIERIRQIQLDALQEGMRRAAEYIDVNFNKMTPVKRELLLLSKQLTVKDL